MTPSIELSTHLRRNSIDELNVDLNAWSGSPSEDSKESHTAAEFINSQLQLEADAHEALPYKFDNCTKPLGRIRQNVFSCLTCNPVSSKPSQPYNPAGICYSCSIQCHGDHKLVELFCKRDFECDCGTLRLPKDSPCTLRIDPILNTKGGIHSDKPSATNKYNHNFENRFCGCECDYNAENERGTMFQCLGLGSVDTGGCGEDWWHAGCIMGLEPNWYENLGCKDKSGAMNKKTLCSGISVVDQVVGEVQDTGDADTKIQTMHSSIHTDDMDLPLPPGFPSEDSFEGFICYKCTDAYPWIKRYAGTPGFLPAVFRRDCSEVCQISNDKCCGSSDSKKKRLNEQETSVSSRPSKIVKNAIVRDPSPIGFTEDVDVLDMRSIEPHSKCKLTDLPPAPKGQFSLFFTEDFRLHLCHCPECYPQLEPHPQLLEIEETYEPTISTDFGEEPDSIAGSGSLYERGESVLQNIDRLRAIEGVMAYNDLRDKLRPFFQKFAESGRAISAEDIKAHFAKIRGDEQGINEAGEAVKLGNHKHEQSGY